jgi:hypothetical protein
MAESEAKKCAHVVCTCIVTDDESYCSQYCEDVGSDVEISCDCRHEGCGIAD